MSIFETRSIELAPEALNPLLEVAKNVYGFVSNLLANMAERDITVDHSTLNQWILKYVPLLEHRVRRRKKSEASSFMQFWPKLREL